MPRPQGAPDSAPKESARPFAALIGAFAAIAIAFGAATVYGEVRALQIDREVESIETNSLPSVDHLVNAQSALRRLETATEEYAHGTDDERRGAARAIEAARSDVDREFAGETSTALYSGEGALVTVTERSLAELEALLTRLRELGSTDPAAARDLSEREVRGSIERTDADLNAVLKLNASEARAEVRRIARIRGGSIRLAFGLDLLCVLLSVTAGFLAIRALRKQRIAERAHEAMLAAKAEELGLFAQRVAHDLLGPLSALSFTLSTVKRNVDKGRPIDEPLERAAGCLKRSQRLVDGVLDFARSGAPPSGSGRASLRDAIDGVLAETRARDDGEASGVEIVVLPSDQDVAVPCSPGVLGSVLANLVRNAIKYIGDGAEKRITLRVLPIDGDVRVEVEDTGPGVPAALASRVFEPYVRAPDNAQPGLGLGLATVKRFVEAHHGRVGFRPAAERGSVFWFQFPRVAAGDGGVSAR